MEWKLLGIMDTRNSLTTSVISSAAVETGSPLTKLRAPSPALVPPAPFPAPVLPTTQHSYLNEPFIPTPLRYSGEQAVHSPVFTRFGSTGTNLLLWQIQDCIYYRLINHQLEYSSYPIIIHQSAAHFSHSLPKSSTIHFRVRKSLNGFFSPLHQGSVSLFSIDFHILAGESGWDEKVSQEVFVMGLS